MLGGVGPIERAEKDSSRRSEKTGSPVTWRSFIQLNRGISHPKTFGLIMRTPKELLQPYFYRHPK